MRIKGCVWILALVVLVSLLSCAANQKQKQAQAKAARELGEAYMRQGNYIEALKELLKSEQLNPGDHLTQNDLGLVYMTKNRYDLAETHFKKAVEIKPDYAAARNNLGTVYLARKDWHAAIKQFKALEGNLLYATPHYPLSNLGFAYYSLGDYRTAEVYYQRALNIEPNFPTALRGLGKTYLAMVKIPEAVSVLEKAVREAPLWPEIYLDMGKAYQLAGEYTKALLAYNKVTELAPDSDISDQALERIKNMQQ
jgi:type IV pilus assembly protein PilF